MSDSKHTPEPWQENQGAVYKAHEYIASCVGTDTTTDEDAANARRIVACVNALAGLNPEGVRELVEAAKDAYSLSNLHESISRSAQILREAKSNPRSHTAESVGLAKESRRLARHSIEKIKRRLRAALAKLEGGES